MHICSWKVDLLLQGRAVEVSSNLVVNMDLGGQFKSMDCKDNRSCKSYKSCGETASESSSILVGPKVKVLEQEDYFY